MNIQNINGNDFERMLKSGLLKIRKHEREINDMNVFPVSDGDTGTNMRLTLQNSISTAPSNTDLGEYLKGIKKGALLGARGNSGVILSQFFTGIADFLKDKKTAGCGDVFDSLVSAYETAYGSVINPVEGTVLTVARMGAEKIRGNLPSYAGSIDAMLSDYVSVMKEVLLETPEMLPVLKESGVLDSGGCGWIQIVRGMLKGLLGKTEDFESVFTDDGMNSKNLPQPVDTDSFTEDSEFNEGYCTEFILQLMSASGYDHDFSMKDFIENLKPLGNSIVAFQDDSRIKVHIHTMKPYKVLELAQRYGEFVTFKMDNMQIQKNEHEFHMNVKKQMNVHKKIAVIAVVNGEGMHTLYESFGCDIIIEGGSTMNTSSKEFVDAFNSLDADHIIVLPNSRNIFFAARQAVEISGKTNVSILESEGQIEGYYALAMGQVETDDFSERLRLMNEGMLGADVISLTFASKPCSQDSVSCKKDDCIAFYKGKLVAASDDIKTTLESAMKKISGMSGKYACMIAVGKNASDEMVEEVSGTISGLFPDLETNVIHGGQDIMHFMIGF